jgi:hypothetical protein
VREHGVQELVAPAQRRRAKQDPSLHRSTMHCH